MTDYLYVMCAIVLGFGMGMVVSAVVGARRDKKHRMYISLLNSRLKSSSTSFKALSKKYSHLNGRMKSICRIAREFDK